MVKETNERTNQKNAIPNPFISIPSTAIRACGCVSDAIGLATGMPWLEASLELEGKEMSARLHKHESIE